MRIIFLFCLSLLFVSCSKKDEFHVNEKNYVVYGNVRPSFEFGYDDNYHAFYTDTKTGNQLVFICSKTNGYYSKEEFLHHFDMTIKENPDLTDTFECTFKWCSERAIKVEKVKSKHFKTEITRYFVDYEDGRIYGCFHI